MWHVQLRGDVKTSFWWGKLKERDHMDDLSVNGNIIIRPKKWDGWGNVNWNDLIEVRDRWRDLVIAIRKLGAT
jgi:hypothetical protein